MSDFSLYPISYNFYMNVYIEPVLFDNFFVDLLLAELTLMFCGRGWKAGKWLSALLGSAFALVFPLVPKWAVIPYKLAVLVVCTVILKKHRNVKIYLKSLLIYAVISFTFGGAVNLVLGADNTINGGATYTSGWIIGATAIGCLLITLLLRRINVWIKTGKIGGNVRIEVQMKDAIMSLEGFIDTGNRLMDGDGKPISVLPPQAKKLVDGCIPKDVIKVVTINGTAYENVYSLDRMLIYCGKSRNTYSNVSVIFSEKAKNHGAILATGYMLNNREGV